MEVNNNTVIVMLIMAIIISLGGTVTVLTKLSDIGGAPVITGLATEQDGTARINISSNLAILIDPSNSEIDFGTCTTPPTGEVATITSEMNEAGINATSMNCSTVTDFPAFIRINNSGNVIAEIRVETDTEAADLLNTDDGREMIAVKGVNGSLDGGCAIDTYGWVELSTAGMEHTICDNLQTGLKTMDAYVNLTVPFDASTGSAPGEAQLRFTAYDSS